jgi:hypothetical protein
MLGAVLVAAIALLGGRRGAQAEASLKQANAEAVQVTSSISAADAIRQLVTANTQLMSGHADTTRQLTEVLAANEKHEEWDRHIVGAVRTLMGAVLAAGISVDLDHIPDPPPLAKRTSTGSHS